MTKRLRIDRIRLRLRGGSAHRARQLGADLQRGLLPALQHGLGQNDWPSGSIRLAELRVPAITDRAAGRATDAIAGSLLGALKSRSGRSE